MQRLNSLRHAISAAASTSSVARTALLSQASLWRPSSSLVTSMSPSGPAITGPNCVPYAAQPVRHVPCRRFTAPKVEGDTSVKPPGPVGISISSEQQKQFHEQGYLVVPNVLSAELLADLRTRVDGLWSGKFETGNYPDEWHWREGLSLPNVTREICNAWKSDTKIASVVLSSGFGRMAATLGGWPGARIGQDDIFSKPPGAKGIAFHQDSSYISAQFVPSGNSSFTIWIALDDVDEQNGTIEYVNGSHRWPKKAGSAASEFHGASSDDYRKQMLEASPTPNPTITRLTLKAGSVVMHHQDTWHGSGPNSSTDRQRRSIAIHVVRSDVLFAEKAGYIYGRYKPRGHRTVPEDYFPVLCSVPQGREVLLRIAHPDAAVHGYRTPWLYNYCDNAVL